MKAAISRPALAPGRVHCESLESRTLLSAGFWDTSFGNGGISQQAWTSNGRIRSLFVQSDDKIVIAGTSNPILARFNPNGLLDPTYGTGGQSNASGDLSVSAYVMQPNDEVVELGIIYSSGSFGLARVGTDGLLDRSFGTNGETAVPAGSSPFVAGLACRPDGKLIALVGGGGHLEFIGFNSNGTLDTTFGNQGVVSPVQAPTGSYFNGNIAAMHFDPLGHIIVAGESGSAGSIARFNPDGTPDPTFGSTGTVNTGEPGLNDAVVQTDGKVVFSGYLYGPTGFPQYYLRRLLANGANDTGFATTIADEVGPYSQVQSLLLESDGKILTGGAAGNKYVVKRFNTNGTLDSSFAPGIATLPQGQGGYAGPLGIAQDGGILLGGDNIQTVNGTPNFTSGGVVRFTGDTPVPTVQIVSNPPSSGGGFTITRTGATSYSLWVNLSAGGSAIAGTDYTAIRPGIGIPAGSRSVTIAVQRLSTASAAPRTVTLQVLGSADMPRYLPVFPQVASVTLGTAGAPLISGKVFVDSNLNGAADSGEPGLAGATVYVDANGNGRLDAGELQVSATSDGTYYLTGLSAGTVTVRQQPPQGYGITAPLGYSASVVVPSSGSAAGPNFADALVASVPMDFNHLLILAQHYNGPGTLLTGDFNADGRVDFSDLLLLAQNYGRGAAAAARYARTR